MISHLQDNTLKVFWRNNMGIVAIIALVLGLAALGYFIFRVIKVSKNHEIGQEQYKIQGKERIELLVSAGLTGLFFLIAAVSLADAMNWELKFFEGFALAIGPFISGAALCVALGGFILFYWKLDLDEKQKKFCKFAFPFGFLAVFLGLFIFSEGIANHLTYPLVNGISVTGWTYPNDGNGSFGVKFYGILIVSGALLCYAITDHMLYQKYKKHGLIDTLFIVAFLFGILGARLWYCLVLEPEYFLANPAMIILGIASGGLAVQGGAMLGIIAGVTYVLVFRKYISLRRVMDIAIPTILLAQAIGRWGNFFNQEVYGLEVTREQLWFLPTIIKNNMLIEGAYRVPLFYIESCINLTGYFIIRYVLGKVAKLHVGLGFQAAAYLVWYGLVRVILEPLREGYHATTSTEGFGYLQSYITAFVMIGLGLLLGAGFFVYHHLRVKKGLEDKFGEKI